MKKILSVIALALVAGCGAALSASDLGGLTLDETQCELPTKAATDTCRAKLHATFCAAHPGVGTMCADAGAGDASHE